MDLIDDKRDLYLSAQCIVSARKRHLNELKIVKEIQKEENFKLNNSTHKWIGGLLQKQNNRLDLYKNNSTKRLNLINKMGWKNQKAFIQEKQLETTEQQLIKQNTSKQQKQENPLKELKQLLQQLKQKLKQQPLQKQLKQYQEQQQLLKEKQLKQQLPQQKKQQLLQQQLPQHLLQQKEQQNQEQQQLKQQELSFKQKEKQQQSFLQITEQQQLEFQQQKVTTTIMPFNKEKQTLLLLPINNNITQNNGHLRSKRSRKILFNLPDNNNKYESLSSDEEISKFKVKILSLILNI